MYVDANWAGCHRSRRSTTGYVIYFQHNVVHSASKTQNSIALSSAESELYAICSGVVEAIHLRSVLSDSGFNEGKEVPIRIHSDSQAALCINRRQGPGKKSKHIQIRFLFVQDFVMLGSVELKKVHTDENMSDLQTKYLSTDKLPKVVGMQMLRFE